nr:MAG: hypothetical protein [Molluscum contagiosum virus]
MDASVTLTVCCTLVKMILPVAGLKQPAITLNFLDRLYMKELRRVPKTSRLVWKKTVLPAGTPSMRTSTSTSWMDTSPPGGTSTSSAASGKPEGSASEMRIRSSSRRSTKAQT